MLRKEMQRKGEMGAVRCSSLIRPKPKAFAAGGRREMAGPPIRSRPTFQPVILSPAGRRQLALLLPLVLVLDLSPCGRPDLVSTEDRRHALHSRSDHSACERGNRPAVRSGDLARKVARFVRKAHVSLSSL